MAKINPNINHTKFSGKNFKKVVPTHKNITQNLGKNDIKKPKKANALDKKKQLGTKKGKHSVDKELTPLQKKNKKKQLSVAIAKELLTLKSSPLYSQYKTTLSCSHTLKQEGKKLITTHCGKRWCPVCNGIRTAKLLTKYEPVFDKLESPYMVTLTVKNFHDGSILRERVGTLTKAISESMHYANKLHRRGIMEVKPRGFRAVEITWSSKSGYHPHIHMVVNSKQLANFIVKRWKEAFPDVSMLAQDIRPATVGSMKELLKYVTKLVNGKKGSKKLLQYPVKVLDDIFCALAFKRVFQPYGLVGLTGDEEFIDKLEAHEYDELKPKDTLWVWVDYDWYDVSNGENLTGSKRIEWLDDVGSPDDDVGSP